MTDPFTTPLCAEVAVDGASGKVKAIRVVQAFECGAILNPDHLKNQNEGMGLGGALFEAIRFDNGKILNPRFSRYRVPRFSDAPAIQEIGLGLRCSSSITPFPPSRLASGKFERNECIAICETPHWRGGASEQGGARVSPKHQNHDVVLSLQHGRGGESIRSNKNRASAEDAHPQGGQRPADGKFNSLAKSSRRGSAMASRTQARCMRR